MSDGRLDEAFEVLSETAVKEHRRGQELIGKLVEMLVARSKQHLEADRYGEALADCDRALKLGGNHSEVVALRKEAIERDRAAAEKARRRKQSINAARRHFEGGEIEMGQLVCNDLSNGSTVAELKREAERRDALIAIRSERVRRAIKENNRDEAIAGLRELKAICPHHEDYLTLRSTVCHEAMLQIESAIDDGRLTFASDAMDRLSGLADSQAHAECRRTLELCQQTAEAMSDNDLRLVTSALRRLQQLRPSSNWIEEALMAAEDSAAARDRLQASPLALLTSSQRSPKFQRPAYRAGGDSHVKVNGDRGPMTSFSDGVADIFVLQVDGAPSCYVHRNATISFGPRSSSTKNDIEILGQGITRVSFHREDGDYFLRSEQPIVVNNRPTESKLLSHGDRVELGPRSSLRFLLPCAASSSGVFDLTGCRTPNGGCRRLIMFDNAIVIANNSASHVRSSAITESHVVFVRDGQLLARPMKANSNEDPIVIGFDRPVPVGDVNVVASVVDTQRNRKV